MNEQPIYITEMLVTFGWGGEVHGGVADSL